MKRSTVLAAATVAAFAMCGLGPLADLLSPPPPAVQWDHVLGSATGQQRNATPGTVAWLSPRQPHAALVKDFLSRSEVELLVRSAEQRYNESGFVFQVDAYCGSQSIPAAGTLRTQP